MNAFQPAAILSVCLISACHVHDHAGGNIRSLPYNEDHIREDTANLNSGRPLKHYSSERRLKMAREDRFLDEIMNR